MNLDISSQECLVYQRIMTYTVSILGTWLRYSRTITAINTLACVRVTINHSLSQQWLRIVRFSCYVNDVTKNGESISNVKNTAHFCSLSPNSSLLDASYIKILNQDSAIKIEFISLIIYGKCVRKRKLRKTCENFAQNLEENFQEAFSWKNVCKFSRWKMLVIFPF